MSPLPAFVPASAKWIVAVNTLLCVLFASTSEAEELRLAVASNFTETARALGAQFADAYAHQVRYSFASSAKLYTQIQHGAPFDILLSADQAIPARLVASGLGVKETLLSYAQGQLVVWSPSAFARKKPPDSAAEILRRGTFNKLAIANPRLAPYGSAAMQVLQKLGLEKSLNSKLVMGDNIAQTLQFVYSGNAELGMIARAQLEQFAEDERGDYWLVPQTLYAPLIHDALVLRAASDKPAAHQFMQFLSSDEARRIIQKMGYQLIERKSELRPDAEPRPIGT